MLNAVEERTKLKLRSPASGGFMQVSTLDQALTVSKIIAESAFCPKAFFGKPGDILVALQYGQELGLKPMQALQNIAVINGKPQLWGDALLAVCMQSPNFEYINEEFIEATKTAVCRVKRKGMPEVIRKFSESDAKRAKLWGKPGPWTDYPERQQGMRARTFALRDAFADVLRGVISVEEGNDIPVERPNYKNVVAEKVEASGNTVNGEIITTISSEQVAILTEMIDKSDTKEENLCRHLGIESLDQMSIDKWDGIYELLEKKIARKQKIESVPINAMFDKGDNSQVLQETAI